MKLENISTHSFRKYFATHIYINNNYNVALVRELLQHSDLKTTQKIYASKWQRTYWDGFQTMNIYVSSQFS